MSVPLGVIRKPLQQPHILLVEVFQTSKVGLWIEKPQHQIKCGLAQP
jgi:hypothetical protein